MTERLYTPGSWLEDSIPVTLVGCGGTGSEMLDALARLHNALVAVGHPGGLRVRVYDPDEVSPTNIIRQRFWPGDQGQNKATLSVHRLNMALGLDWEAVPAAYDPAADDGPDGMFVGYRQTGLLITCVDKATVRAQIAAQAPFLGNLLWLDTGNGARDGQVVLGELGQGGKMLRSGQRLPHVLDLFPEIKEMPDDDAPSCSAEEALAAQDFGVNRFVADTAANLLWQLLRYGSTNAHGAFIRLDPMRVSPLAIDPTVWATFGYEPPSS